MYVCVCVVWFGLVWFGLIWLNLVVFYGFSALVGYLMPNPLIYIYIYMRICMSLCVWFSLVWFGFMAYQPLKVI